MKKTWAFLGFAKNIFWVFLSVPHLVDNYAKIVDGRGRNLMCHCTLPSRLFWLIFNLKLSKNCFLRLSTYLNNLHSFCGVTVGEKVNRKNAIFVSMRKMKLFWIFICQIICQNYRTKNCKSEIYIITLVIRPPASKCPFTQGPIYSKNATPLYTCNDELKSKLFETLVFRKCSNSAKKDQFINCATILSYNIYHFTFRHFLW